jgi:aryl-alcohol dehydrogenase-like predicted oxidoreductase
LTDRPRVNPSSAPRDASFPALSRLSLGCATFGREIDQEAAHGLMDEALARGLTHFDTAAGYSAGVSEAIVGAWLASRRPPAGSVSVATKIRPPYTPQAMENAVAASAKRLGVSTIDLLYLHLWDPSVETPAALAMLDQLVQTGRVQALGASNFTASQLGSALASQSFRGLIPFHFVQNNHNLAVRGIDELMLAQCRAHNVAIVTYSPLGAGFLTGKHRAGVQPGSRFAIMPAHQEIYSKPFAKRQLERLAELSDRTGQSMTHLALVWALHQPEVTSTLIGGRAAWHIDQALAALSITDPELLGALAAC